MSTFKPMTYHTFKSLESLRTDQWGRVITTVKEDGVFVMVAKDNQLITRQGIKLFDANEIGTDLSTILTEGMYFFGEVVGEGLTRQEISGRLTQQRLSGNADVSKLSIVFFDMHNPGNPLQTFHSRLEELVIRMGNRYRIVHHRWVTSVHNVVGVAEEHISSVKGAEGIMVHNPNGIYSPNKRTWDTVKMKRCADAEFVVTGFKKGKARGSVLIKSSDGEIKASTNYLATLPDIEVGAIVTIQYMEVTDSSLTHPRIMEVRDDKTLANTADEARAAIPYIFTKRA